MPTDELRHARPKWLFRLSIGIWFLLASAVPLAGYMALVVLIPFGFVDISWSQYNFINYELPQSSCRSACCCSPRVSSSSRLAKAIFTATKTNGIVVAT